MSEIDKELAELEKSIEVAKSEQPKAPEPVQAPEPEAVKTQPEPIQSEAPSVEPDEEVKQWVQKKGWKSAEDAARSMRALEQEFHKKNQELSQLKQNQYQPPENPYAPQQYQQPAYQPYQQPAPNYGNQNYQQRQLEEQIAASHNLSVEDFRKVFEVASSVSAIRERKLQEDFNKRLEAITSETDKNADMANVVGDPAFHNPDVQFEMHEILSKNPTAFQTRKPYTAALEKALVNIGRKNALRGSNGYTSTLPTEPPKAVGGASSFSGRKNGVPSLQDFGNKSPEEMEKMLKGMNAFKTYDSMA